MQFSADYNKCAHSDDRANSSLWGSGYLGSDPGHVPYANHYRLWQRVWPKQYELLKLYWQPYLDGGVSIEQAIDKIVGAL